MTIEERRSEADLVAACAEEPIRTPGLIQSHGTLLAVDEQRLLIEHASANVGEHFSLDGRAAVGQRLGAIIGEREGALLEKEVATRLVSPRPALLTTVRSTKGEAFDVLAHQHEGIVILELEPSPLDSLRVRQAPYELNTVVDQMRRTETPEELFEATAAGVRALTGFDKVMVYRFDAEWNGTVVAEAQVGGMDAYMGHRFPASDIPAQARELYRLNPTRIVHDVHASPVAVLPVRNARTGNLLDMTYAALRSVSPVHIQYLKNMGVGASMSISILQNGKLWGLIACHHRVAFYMPHHLRVACQFLGEMFVAQLAEKEGAREKRGQDMALQRLALVTEGLKESAHVGPELRKRCGELMRLIDSDGIAVCIDGEYVSAGVVPKEADVRGFGVWLRDHAEQRPFHSDWIAEIYPEGERFKAAGSGVMAITLATLRDDFLIWFRAEQMQTVKWAGNPTKLQTGEEGRLTPRKSFEVWTEEVGKKSREWRAFEVEIATRLREGLIDILMRRAEIATAKAKDDFMAILSHELRTPLNPVLLAVSALESDAPPGGQTGELLALIRRNVQIQARLIDDLLDVTRISTGKLSLILDVVDMHGVLRQAVEVCEHEAREKGVQLSLELDAKESFATADMARMQQVFWNLLKNAIKFTKAGGMIRVTTANVGQGMLRIEVSDTGAGINEALLPHIFNAYEQGGRSTTERYGGLGLGLAISQSLVELHRGTIRARSEGVGKGATFTVEISTAVRPAAAGPATRTVVKEGMRLRILLVEDHVETSRVMVKLLTQSGYDVEAANTVARARELNMEGRFDLIISDLGLPDGNGIALLSELRKKRRIPAIALSGYGMEQHVRECMDAGFDRHLLKPVSFKALQETIRELLSAGQVAGVGEVI